LAPCFTLLDTQCLFYLVHVSLRGEGVGDHREQEREGRDFREGCNA
jgi:hypothetical protein